MPDQRMWEEYWSEYSTDEVSAEFENYALKAAYVLNLVKNIIDLPASKVGNFAQIKPNFYFEGVGHIDVVYSHIKVLYILNCDEVVTWVRTGVEDILENLVRKLNVILR